MSRLSAIKGLMTPLTGAIYAAEVAAMIGAPLAVGAIQDVTGVTEERQNRAQQKLSKERLKARLVDIEARRMQGRMNENMSRIQQFAPHVYKQVISGRVLPQGATVLGGSPREDLLQNLAMYMGDLQTQDSISSLL
jgi:hypothetical protein